MRLEKIHIAGFKSFVEPTTVHFPSSLVGVVGPNGCGKSNVIDAVRWVMGESSARLLRGESMTDVIFNGSSQRKPVGTASIELVFDNTQGRAAGQYAAYSQISVRRTLSRDGQSTYYLNSSRCRRRDITDLFLGTGLGPRSYSIIEQGMISRIIEARPEDLRLFLEEAAGISKYKERRRETETRMQHTRENLSRLNDLRDEVAKQLRHLEQQAATAERYKRLKQEERELRASLLGLRWQLLGTEVSEAKGQLGEQATALEAATSQLRAAEAALEQGREAQITCIDRVNQEQGRVYALGAEISRLEQRLRFGRDNRQRLEKELTAAYAELKAIQERQAEDETRLDAQQAQCAKAGPELAGLQAQEQASATSQREAEARLQDWQRAWDEFNRQAARPVQAAQVERTRINQLERQLGQLGVREQRLEQERQAMNLDEEEARLEQLNQTLSQAEQTSQAIEHQGRGLQQTVMEAREAQTQAQQHQQRLQLEASRLAGRLSSVEALQQAALHRDQGREAQALVKALQSLGLNDAPRLAELLSIPEDWREAVGQLLGQRLRTLCVTSLDVLQQGLAAHGQPLDFLECQTPVDPASLPMDALPADALLRLLEPEQSRVLAPWLAGVRLVGSLAEGLARRGELGLQACWLTPTGERIGPNWLMSGGEAQTSGLLQREQALRELKDQQQGALKQQQEAAAELGKAKAALHEAEVQLEQQRQAQMQRTRELAGLRSQHSGLKGRIEGLIRRRQSLMQELTDISQQTQGTQAELEQSRHTLAQALAESEALEAQRLEKNAKREQLQQALAQLREQDLRLRSQVKEAAIRLQALKSDIQSLEAGLAQAQGRSRALDDRIQQYQVDLGQLEAPLAQDQAELRRQLDLRLAAEQALSQARSAQSEQEQQLRQQEQQRHQAEQGLGRSRDQLETARLRLQELEVRWMGLNEQLAETGLEPQALLAALPANIESETLVIQLEAIGAKIERLGRVNLAAIDEFQQQSERMSYLEQQHQDISQALEVLEEAIRKIDRETRARFRETFERVNSGFQALFPKLFGGGHAALQLLGEDLLDAGVSVMARPPGKRNTSIQLLSGGEKALTAVALVFAIFELNPAPFCMLDEVDAPLDEANVGRFCTMVREMSDKVQFIFITHNKITMELSSQLIGVTMHEPGVSRIVSVDMAEAVRMAAV
jgi:chromosome segregation protein